MDIAAVGETIAISSPSNKQIDYYAADLTFQNSLKLEKRIYQLAAAPSGRLLACGSTSRTGDGLLYDIAPDQSINTIPGSRIGFNLPSAMALDADGNFYIADMGNHRVLVFDSDLELSATITGIPPAFGSAISGRPALCAGCLRPRYFGL